MTSSSSAIALVPAHPETAQNEAAAIDQRHPRLEPGAQPEIADQSQDGDAGADHDKSPAEPQSGDGVEQHEIAGPERAHLARREMAEPAAGEDSEHKQQHERRQHPEIKGAGAG